MASSGCNKNKLLPKKEKKNLFTSNHSTISFLRMTKILNEVSHNILTFFLNGCPSKMRECALDVVRQSGPTEDSKESFQKFPCQGKSIGTREVGVYDGWADERENRETPWRFRPKKVALF